MESCIYFSFPVLSNARDKMITTDPIQAPRNPTGAFPTRIAVSFGLIQVVQVVVVIIGVGVTGLA